MSFLVVFYLFIPSHFGILVFDDFEFLSLLLCIKVFIEKIHSCRPKPNTTGSMFQDRKPARKIYVRKA